jgi:hypothetical protein
MVKNSHKGVGEKEKANKFKAVVKKAKSSDDISNAEVRDLFIEAMELLYKVFADLSKVQEYPGIKIDLILAKRRLARVEELLPQIKRFFDGYND